MKTLKECATLEEGLDKINTLVNKAKEQKKEYSFDDHIIIANLIHELDNLLNYKPNELRK